MNYTTGHMGYDVVLLTALANGNEDADREKMTIFRWVGQMRPVVSERLFHHCHGKSVQSKGQQHHCKK